MASVLTSTRHETDSYENAMALIENSGWSDGLPTVPPTEKRVSRFLEHSGYSGDEVLVTIAERDKAITAEKLAINSVLAGCLPEYMPVIVAIMEALTHPRFRFNHLASLGSPWPVIVVNGPIAKELGIFSGMYCFGPGHRANLTIARAVSLTLRNCAGARNEDVQRGQWGHSLRLVGCISENEETPWVPLHVERGFSANSSTVTVASTYPGSPSHVTVNLDGENPNRMLDGVCHAIANWGGAQWTRGAYGLFVSPHMVDIFVRAGWSKSNVSDYIVENTTSSIAELKYRGAWGRQVTDVAEDELALHPADVETRLHLFKENPAYDRFVALGSALDERELGVFVVVAGGDAGARMQITIPYQVSSNPVTTEVRHR